MKKLYTSFILSLISIAAFAQDSTGPVINSITTDAPSYNAGDRITVTVNTNDPETGLFYVDASISSPTDRSIWLNEESVNGNEYVFTATISRFVESGTYTINVDAVNNAFATTTDNFTTINVINTGAVDTTGPQINSVSLLGNQTSYNAGETITFVVDATDNASGVDYFWFDFAGADLDYELESKNGNIFTYTATTSSFYPSTDFTINEVNAIDFAGNQTSDDLIPTLDFTVTNSGTVDTVAPMITSLSIVGATNGNISVLAGDEITFNATITDDVSGVDIATFLDFVDNNDEYLEWYVDDKLISQGGNNYQFTLTVPQYGTNGTFNFDYFSAQDVAGNETEIYTVSPNLSITVSGSTVDDQAPVVADFAINDNIVSFTATDDVSGFDYVLLDFINGNTFEEKSYLLVNGNIADLLERFEVTLQDLEDDGLEVLQLSASNNSYSITLDTQNWTDGTYSVTYADFNDIAGNYTEISTTETIVIGSTIGIFEQPALSSLELFPNPATNVVTINSSSNETIEVYSLGGSIVNVPTSGNTIDVSQLQIGVYIVKQGNTVTRLIKK